MHFPIDRTTHTTAFDGPIVNDWLEWKIAQIENTSVMQHRSTMQKNLYSRVLYDLRYAPPPSMFVHAHLHMYEKRYPAYNVTTWH